MKRIFLTLLIISFSLGLKAEFEKGERLFRVNCAACHAMERRLVGPPMLGSSDYWDTQENLIAFIRNSTEVIEAGHPRAVGVFEEYNRMIMPPFPQLSDEEIQSILYYVDNYADYQLTAETDTPEPDETVAYIPPSMTWNDAVNQYWQVMLLWGATLILMIYALWAIRRSTVAIKATLPEKKYDPNIKRKITFMHLFRREEHEVKDVLMEDHEYDGINEYDNNPPTWFNWLFYGTIVWSVFYLLYFHVFNIGLDQHTAYERSVLRAEQELLARGIDRTLNFDDFEADFSTAALESGERLYITNCAQCHGNLGEGGIGPNLTDHYFIHGSSFQDVMRVTYEGVPQKGMVPWKGTLTNHEIVEVSSYVMTLIGTDPPGGKAPEGEFIPGEELTLN